MTGVPLPNLTFAGGSAGPSNAADYNPVSFNDGSFVVGTSALGTDVAGGVAGATNSFSLGLGQLTPYMPYLLLAGVAWFVIRHRR